MQYAQEVIVKRANTCERNPAANSVAQALHSEPGDSHVPQWMKAVQAMRQDQQEVKPSALIPTIPAKSLEGTHSVLRQVAPAQDAHKREASDSDDDLDTDFAKAALSTGSQAFDAEVWDEANSLLQEALRILEQLRECPYANCV
jgi:hypothetical protein